MTQVFNNTLKTGLANHKNIIGNKYIPYSEAIEAGTYSEVVYADIYTRVMNPTQTSSMSEMDFSAAQRKVYNQLEQNTKSLVADIKKLLAPNYKNVVVTLVVEDEAMGDGEYWATIRVEAKSK